VTKPQAHHVWRLAGNGAAGREDLPGDVSWSFDSKRKVCFHMIGGSILRVIVHYGQVLRWEIQNMPTSSSFHLRGSFTSRYFSSFLASPDEANYAPIQLVRNTPAPLAHCAFDSRSTNTFSALKVEQLRITGEGYKPYKGVRGRSVGDVEWRW
jgi:hypothetical protein